MEHKAFIFDYFSFEEELKELLESALQNDQTTPIINFIEKNRNGLTDPYEGEPLQESWKNWIETKDVHQYGDFALTKYYNPVEDLGLGYEFTNAENALKPGNWNEKSPLYGIAIGSEENYFDPGKMGSYLQSPSMVLGNLSRLTTILEKNPNLSESLEEVISYLQQAKNKGMGLYITF